MHRAMGDPDTKAEAPARNLMDVGGTSCELLGCLGIDRRNRGAEGDPLGGECQARALRHIAVSARHVDPGKAAPLDLAGDLQRFAAPPWHGDKADRGHRLRQRRLPKRGLAPATLVTRTSCWSQEANKPPRVGVQLKVESEAFLLPSAANLQRKFSS